MTKAIELKYRRASTRTRTRTHILCKHTRTRIDNKEKGGKRQKNIQTNIEEERMATRSTQGTEWRLAAAAVAAVTTTAATAALAGIARSLAGANQMRADAVAPLPGRNT